jgi:protein CpxP
MSRSQTTEAAKQKDRRIYWSLVALSVFAAMVVASAAVAYGGFGMRGFHGRWGQHGDSERMQERMAFAIEFGLRRIDATPEQEVRIQDIASETLQAMVAGHEGRGLQREALRDLVNADEIDREAFEAMRVKHIEMADAASQTILAALTEALEVLTPEQRASLTEQLASHHPGR